MGENGEEWGRKEEEEKEGSDCSSKSFEMYEPLAWFRVEEVVWKRGRSIRIKEDHFGIL